MKENPIELINWDEEEVEECCICGTKTDYWSLDKDVPLCPKCAATNNINSIPSKRDWLISLGYQLPTNWKADVEK